MHVLPIASGKGGVGKSLVASNLAIALASMGQRVILADLDLGASNLHLMLGLRGISTGIGTFLNSPSLDFSEILLTTEYHSMRFIPGDAEIPGMANLKTAQKTRLIKELLSLDADYLIIDLGAGTSYNTVDFFLISGNGIVVTTPTLTATLSAYLFIKNTVFRILETVFNKKTSPATEYLSSLREEGRSLQKIYIPQILEKLKKLDPTQHEIYQERIKHFHPKLVLNMLTDPKDSQKAGKLRRSCSEYLGIELEHLGIMYRDDLQNVALSSNLPIMIYKPQSVLSHAIERIADKLISAQTDDSSPIDLRMLEESYNTANMEAEIDFDAKFSHLSELLQCGTFTEGDLVETIKSQQLEIRQLRKENQLIKTKLVKAINAGFRI